MHTPVRKKPCNSVMSKTRLSPLKALTIARLELQAAVLAVRLNSAIQEEFDLKTTYKHFWTDSRLHFNILRMKKEIENLCGKSCGRNPREH